MELYTNELCEGKKKQKINAVFPTEKLFFMNGNISLNHTLK